MKCAILSVISCGVFSEHQITGHLVMASADGRHGWVSETDYLSYFQCCLRHMQCISFLVKFRRILGFGLRWTEKSVASSSNFASDHDCLAEKFLLLFQNCFFKAVSNAFPYLHYGSPVVHPMSWLNFCLRLLFNQCFKSLVGSLYVEFKPVLGWLCRCLIHRII